MKKSYLVLVVITIIAILLITITISRATPSINEPSKIITLSDAAQITYSVEGEQITLKDGIFVREAAPGSAAKETFALFGDPTQGDIDGDGDLDQAIYLTRDSGGSGTFFYVVVARNDGGKYTGTNAMFLGDRIAPQNITFMDGKMVANFAERKQGESFAVPPSVGKSITIHLDTRTNEIGELVNNFEGEADPSHMNFGMKSWEWVSSTIGGIQYAPKKSGIFSLTFNKDGSVAIKTDCNSMGGSYKTTDSNLTFENLVSTLMFCEGSQESEFSSPLSDVTSYEFTTKGELILYIKGNGGEIKLR